MLNQKIALQLVVIIAKERLRTPIAALGHMVGNMRENDARQSCHEKTLTKSSCSGN